MAGGVPFAGTCDPRFAAVDAAFRNNFAAHGEYGAAVCVIVDGRVVVDLSGGWADRGRRRPWTPDLLVNFFSIGKGLTALCALMLIDRGRFRLDQPLSSVWQEFAAEGKEHVTFRQVLSHQAGLPAIRRLQPARSMLNWPHMCAVLAAQAPWWKPGTAHGYHVNTFGYLVGEVVRRVDGRTLGGFLHDEVARPLGADVHIGLPDRHHGRVAEFQQQAARAVPAGAVVQVPGDIRSLAYNNPIDFSGSGVVNTPEWRRAEIPSTNGHGSARGAARVYAALAGWGTVDGVFLITKDTLAEATSVHSSGDDIVLGRPSRFGAGFQLTQPERPLGPNKGFGHFGAGGSLGFCDPDAGMAFGYVMNTMGPRWQNPRNRGLIDAVYASL